MTEIHLHIESLEEMGLRFIDTWKRAEAGEAIDELHLSAESPEALKALLKTDPAAAPRE